MHARTHNPAHTTMHTSHTTMHAGLKFAWPNLFLLLCAMVWHDSTYWYVERKPWFTGKEKWQLTEVRQTVSLDGRRVWYRLYYKEGDTGEEQWVEEEIHNNSRSWFKGGSTCLVDSRLQLWTQWEDKVPVQQEPKVQEGDTGEKQDAGDISDMDLAAPPPTPYPPETEVAVPYPPETEVAGQASGHVEVEAQTSTEEENVTLPAILRRAAKLKEDDDTTDLEVDLARLRISREQRYNPY